jgi:hypothetical protein
MCAFARRRILLSSGAAALGVNRLPDIGAAGVDDIAERISSG